MNAKTRKQLKHQLEKLSRAQLVSLATQKEAMPYIIAKGQTKEALVEALVVVEGVLKPEQA